MSIWKVFVHCMIGAMIMGGLCGWRDGKNFLPVLDFALASGLIYTEHLA